MSTEAISWVFRHSRSKGATRLVLLAIAYHADEEGLAWPSKAEISRDSGVCFSQIKRSFQQLVENAEISITRETGPNGTNVYMLPFFHSFLHRGGALDTRGAIGAKFFSKDKYTPRAAQRISKKERELWNALNVGAGPKIQ